MILALDKKREVWRKNSKTYRDNHPDRIVESRKLYHKKHPEAASVTSKLWRERYPSKAKERSDRFNKKVQLSPEMGMFYSAKRRAKAKGLPFSIEVSDIVIPDFCPAVGIPIYKQGKHTTSNSPSLDRITPALGYVKGNIVVVSYMANTMKSNATLEQMEMLVGFYRNLIEQKEEIY